jgi:hypothetical protein
VAFDDDGHYDYEGKDQPRLFPVMQELLIEVVFEDVHGLMFYGC